ncbi:hypothetical protein ACFQ7W_05445 [Streptomyces niveus]|uniref:hypothetical protein n=1 Tax=Streptomyces niveus TaxID=193462 RepID=UPI0035DF5C3C
MTERYGRPEKLKQEYADLFKVEREEKLPVWAQIKLNQLRDLLIKEADEGDLLREEIERTVGRGGS